MRNWQSVGIFSLIIGVFGLIGIGNSAEPWVVYQLSNGQTYVTQTKPEIEEVIVIQKIKKEDGTTEEKKISQGVFYKFKEGFMIMATINIPGAVVKGKSAPGKSITGLFPPAVINMKPLTSVALLHIMGTREMAQGELDILRANGVMLEKQLSK